jgi:hypothetical protein
MINILFNGIGNYDIAIKVMRLVTASKPLTLNIQKYAIENFKFKYFDESSKIKMVIDSINHEGTGDLPPQN